jgi:Flp pilus assembly protein TadG
MMMKRIGREESGQTLVYVALSLVTLLLFVALAIEAGHLYAERRRMQNAADAGALAGVRELCLGSAAPTAVAVARTYAVTKNGATWATPVASGQSLTVNALENVNLFFGGLGGIVPVSMTVGASARGLCQSTTSGCMTWPITVKKTQYDERAETCLPPPDGTGIGRTIYISFDNFDCDPSKYVCDDIFTGGDANSQRGWYSVDPNSCNVPFLRGALNGGYPQFPITVGSCVGGDSGEKMGVIGGSNGKEIADWLASHTDHRVLIPLYNCRGGNGPGADGGCPCQKPGSCQGGYHVGGFACIEIMSWQKSYDVPRQPGNSKKKAIGAIEARIRCDCTSLCGQKGGTPVPGDTLIPALAH